MKTKNWLITGGCGFIGTALIQRLVKEGGHNIRVFDNLSVGTREDLARVCDFIEIDTEILSKSSNESRGSTEPSAMSQEQLPLELFVGDITDAEICNKAAMGIDIIVHLAANTGVPQSLDDPKKDMESNVMGTFNMLEAARENSVKRFIFASSGAPIGECIPPINEEMPCHPVSPYGASKLAGEAYCSAYFKSFGIETVVLRFGNAYGPGSTHKNSVVAKFIKQAIEGKTLEVYGDGTQTRDFIFIDDLVEAILCSAKVNGIGGEVFQIATSRESTINELLEIIVPALKNAGVAEVNLINGKKRKGDVKRNFSDTSKAKERLGWDAKITTKEGIQNAVRWFIKRIS